MMRCSRPMSWAVASTWLIGGRRRTSLRPFASVTPKVRFDRPPEMKANSNGPATPSTWASSHAVTRSTSTPSMGFPWLAMGRTLPERFMRPH